MQLRNMLCAFALAMVLLAPKAQAQPRPNVFDGGNLWYITFYDDTSPVHQQWATQVICFSPYVTVGTTIQGFWFSLSFPNWNGRYMQEGDEVRMTGDYAADIGHDSMEFRHTESDQNHMGEGQGTWDEWREDGGFGKIIGWGNTRLRRNSKCFPHGTGTTTPTVAEWERTALALSQQLPDRMRRNPRLGAVSDTNDKRSEDVNLYIERNRQTINSFFDIFVDIAPTAAAAAAESDDN